METGREQEKKTEKLEVNPRYGVSRMSIAFASGPKNMIHVRKSSESLIFFGVGIDFRCDRPAAMRNSPRFRSFAPKRVPVSGENIQGTFVLDILEVNFNGAAGGHDRCPSISIPALFIDFRFRGPPKADSERVSAIAATSPRVQGPRARWKGREKSARLTAG